MFGLSLHLLHLASPGTTWVRYLWGSIQDLQDSPIYGWCKIILSYVQGDLQGKNVMAQCNHYTYDNKSLEKLTLSFELQAEVLLLSYLNTGPKPIHRTRELCLFFLKCLVFFQDLLKSQVCWQTEETTRLSPPHISVSGHQGTVDHLVESSTIAAEPAHRLTTDYKQMG